MHVHKIMRTLCSGYRRTVIILNRVCIVVLCINKDMYQSIYIYRMD